MSEGRPGPAGMAAASSGVPTVAKAPRVVIVDADPLAADALRCALQQAGAAVAALVHSGADAIRLSREHVPDIVFLHLAPREGLTVIERTVAMNLGIRPILVTAEHDFDAALAALRAGARGFLSKAELVPCDLSRLLTSAMDGELVCSRRLASSLVERLLASRSVIGPGYRPVRSRLTNREWEILDLLCASCSTEQIAETLVISIETVRSHIKNINRKLGASSRAQTIALASGLRDLSGDAESRQPRAALVRRRHVAR